MVRSHPKTFDEVIARGFPVDQLLSQARDHAVRTRSRLLPRAARVEAAPVAGAAVTLATRKDQRTLPLPEQTALKNAIVQLVTEGKYLELTQFHMDMSHNMHGSMGIVGLYRFLAWHRRYLMEMEKEIQRVDQILRPAATEKLGIPYWRWQDPFPAWMAAFLPATDPDSGDNPPPRKNASPPQKANDADVDTIVNQFGIQIPGTPVVNDYVRFTYGVEGWGSRPDGTSLPAHNHGHSWIGGIMNNTSTSPTDPMFWFHHSEVDRLWQIWRQANPATDPPLTGTDLIMDPWTESYGDLLDISALGYQYESMAL